MHVAERERVVAVELSVPEAVGVGEDETDRLNVARIVKTLEDGISEKLLPKNYRI